MGRRATTSAGDAPEDLPGLFLVLADPAEGVQDAGFLAWYRSHHGRFDDVGGLVRVRHLRLATEQLLPHRAQAASHRFAAVYEFETGSNLFAAAGRLHPAQGRESADVVDLVRVRSACFLQIHEVTTPPPLPSGAPERPQCDVPRAGTGTFMAFTRPTSAATEVEYNDWYDEHHLPETLLLEGVLRGRRYRRIASPPALAGRPVVKTPYLTYYDLNNIAAIPFDRDVLLPWLDDVGEAHLGPPGYDRAFTQAFVHEDIDLDGSPLSVAR